MDLAQTIKQYYFDHLDELAPDKQFHFASRLAAWEGDEKARQILQMLKGFMVPDPSHKGLIQLMKNLISQSQKGKRNAHELRQPFFQKYPLLWGVHLALFRTRHLKAVYGIDCLPALYEIVGKNKLDQLFNDLLNDQEALRILSTFAINYFYLYRFILQNQDIDPSVFLNVSQGYDLSDKRQVQLMIYLFTHCIIGESNFYTVRISQSHLSVYRQMLKILEDVINRNYDQINLDNKLEFLVCCRICGYKTPLFETIWDECQRSISQDGQFLVDTHNANPQDNRKTFEFSEHRNVLFIMSTSPYAPQSILVS